jgi:tRNA wybutosine-synthesizing protein 1
MVKEFKGTPGVIPARWAAAGTPRHCALSLVGEPIMYPHINQLLRLLHARRISTFLVTNAQFPDAIAALEPVTQLYVSIDAPTRDALRAVDRPLFSDFWERFLGCLDALRAKRQRTVYRLTLIAGPEGNMGPDSAAQYAALIARGRPELIEVKGVTWSGVSDGSNLTMASVPWHADVKRFCEELAGAVAAAGGDPPAYGLAAEHAHSCCVLLAQEKYRAPGGGWNTWVDYERFQDLAAAWYAGGPAFGAEDFWAPAPHWAAYGAAEQGFDPEDKRWRRGDGAGGGGGVHAQGGEGGGAGGAGGEEAYAPSESGCG